MATKEQVARIHAASQQITQSPIDSLVHNPRWGEIDFELARPALQTIFDLCGYLNELPLEIVPGPTLDTFFQATNQCLSLVDRIRKFSVAGSDSPKGTRDQIASELSTQADQMLSTMQGWIAFLAYQKGDIQRNMQLLSEAVRNAQSTEAEAKTTLETKKVELDGIISAAREASASVGVAHFTSDFSGQATTLEGDAKLWLRWTGGLAFATGGAALASFLVPISRDATNAQVLQYLTSKLVLLATLLTATIWCGRIYRAIKHQAAVCSHRANSLKSFQAFVKATSDEGTRNAVLLETTRSIFALSPSGYLDSADSSSDGGSKILEIVKSAAGGKPN